MLAKIEVVCVYIIAALKGMFSSTSWYTKKRPDEGQECSPLAMLYFEGMFHILKSVLSNLNGPHHVLSSYSTLKPENHRKIKIYSLSTLPYPTQAVFFQAQVLWTCHLVEYTLR